MDKYICPDALMKYQRAENRKARMPIKKISRLLYCNWNEPLGLSP